MAALEISELTKTYPQATAPAVDGVSLTVPAGSILGLLGPNGAGKTTTIKILAGLLAATSGRVRLNGVDPARQRSRAMGRFGAVLEGSRNVYWTLSAWQNLLYFGRLKGMRAAPVRARAEELLTGLGLWDRRHDRVGGFSRGMQQKVAIAAALVTDPAIVLLDEPTLGLDVEGARTIEEWVRALARERGTTVLLTTHQLDVVERLCDRVAVMRRGRVVADRPIGELLAGFAERDRYEFTVEGRLPASALPPGFEMSERDGVTTATGPVPDAGGVYDLLDRLRGHQVVLRSFTQVRPDLEDAFLALVREPAGA